MCGLAAVNNKENAPTFLIDALKRMEYRGYDSWGIATLTQKGFNVSRRLGSVSEASWGFGGQFDGKIGIGHTRWASNGTVCIKNTHPIAGGQSSISCQVVHNGIIENSPELKEELESAGYKFKSQTDTEVVGHLFDFYLHCGQVVKKRPEFAPKINWTVSCWEKAIQSLKGSFALAMITTYCPDVVFLAANGSPLLISEEGYAVSDPNALHGYADGYFSLPDKHVAIMTDGDVFIFNELGEQVFYPTLYYLEDANRYEVIANSYMEKEILEQPTLLRNLNDPQGQLRGDYYNVLLYGCGSSYNAALLGKHYFRHFGILAQTEFSTEIVDNELNANSGISYIALTQSGETKDTINAANCLRKKSPLGCFSLLTNGKDSTAVRQAGKEKVVFLDCGPEYGVAATKTFTMQCVRLYQMALGSPYIYNSFKTVLPDAIDEVIANREEICELARELIDWEHIIYLGRGMLYPIALEGALKMKEVAYKHAEAIHAAEMKHGPIALIDNETLCLFLLTNQDEDYLNKVKNNISEIRARDGIVYLIGDKEAVEKVGDMAERVFVIPSLTSVLQPLVVNVVLQLLAYYAATLQGINPDRPKSLAKAVSVE